MTRNSSGVRSVLASESVRIRNAATGTLLATVAANSSGWLVGGSLSVAVGTEIEFYSATKSGTIRQITAETAADAVATQVTLVLNDAFVTTKTSHFADIYIADEESGVPPVFLGTQVKGTQAKWPFESAFSKNLRIVAVSRTKDGEFADTALYQAASDAIAPASTRPADQIEIGVTAITGGINGRVLFNNAGVLGQRAVQSITGSTVQDQIDSIVSALVALGVANDDR